VTFLTVQVKFETQFNIFKLWNIKKTKAKDNNQESDDLFQQ